ncbi:hypothetical protein P8A18_15270 [Streptomyces castrisilvae]|uniref:Type I restriction modification DNA specificity domain-containing protein n=1 Tax=Streptomyces castrisilvae TaxID=3033811 RepID=A0ABY9HMG3_9ACTN|nr:hypothetical protein [Streptomyces sp. Mut1]WLQ34711.1 hypothetical protein P8A18_15270 [Streptomyces sp. Mut1]
MSVDLEWETAPLSSRLVRIDAGHSPDLPDAPAGAGDWGVLKVSAVHKDGFRPRENKAVGLVSGLIDSRYEVQPGDLLFSRANTPELVGASCIAIETPERLMLSDKTLRLVLDPDAADAHFVNICLSSPSLRRQIGLASSGSSRSMQNISQRAIRNFLLKWPTLKVQRRIVEILDAVSESERAVQAIISKLRTVRGGIALHGMESIMSSEVPSDWERVALREVVPSVDYGISVALDDDSRGVATLRMNNLLDGRPELGDLRYCPQDVQTKPLLRVGDVLFNRTNSIEHVGKSALWGGEIEKATFASYLVRLNPDFARLNPGYLVEWLQHPAIRQRVRSIATVAVQQVNVNPGRLRDLLIDFPTDLQKQAEIVASLEVCDRQISVERESLAKIRVMKQGISDALLNGGMGKLDRLTKAAESGAL